MDQIIFALWFFWAAGVATIAPVIAAMLPGPRKFNAPMDGGRSYRGVRLLGPNKTWRGLIAATVVGTVWFGLQILMYRQSDYLQSITPFDMSQFSSIWIGFCLGLGAIVGDAVKSFFKRQRKVEPGKSWFPFDQIDFIIGGIIFTLPLVQLSPITYAYILVTWLCAHLLVKAAGYFVGINKQLI